jgi:hypothetical protein
MFKVYRQDLIVGSLVLIYFITPSFWAEIATSYPVLSFIFLFILFIFLDWFKTPSYIMSHIKIKHKTTVPPPYTSLSVVSYPQHKKRFEWIAYNSHFFNILETKSLVPRIFCLPDLGVKWGRLLSLLNDQDFFYYDGSFIIPEVVLEKLAPYLVVSVEQDQPLLEKASYFLLHAPKLPMFTSPDQASEKFFIITRSAVNGTLPPYIDYILEA